MESLINIINDSVDKYFTILTNTGYVKNDLRDSLLSVIIVQYIIDNFIDFLTDKDLKKLYQFLYCNNGNCIVPLTNVLMEYTEVSGIMDQLDKLQLRKTNEDILNLTEFNSLRSIM